MEKNREFNIESDDAEGITNYAGQNYRLSPEEREIILVMDDKDRKWKASCSSPTYMRKFEKQGWECTETEYYRDGSVCTKFYKAPQASSITIGKAERPKRQGKPMSEERKRKLQESLQRARDTKNAPDSSK